MNQNIITDAFNVLGAKFDPTRDSILLSSQDIKDIRHVIKELRAAVTQSIIVGIDFEIQNKELRSELLHLKNGFSSIDELPHNALYTAREIERGGLILSSRGTPYSGLSATSKFLKKLFPENTSLKQTPVGIRPAYSGAKLNEHNNKIKSAMKLYRPMREAFSPEIELSTDGAQVINTHEAVDQIQ